MLVVVIGNVIGCALFGLFCIMGHRTGVNQMVLSRAAFGRRGAYLPATAQMLMTMGWLGVNTWVVLDLCLGIFKEMGYDHPRTGTKYAVGIVIMAVMSVLAWTKADVAWTHSTVHGRDKLTSITQLMTAIGVGWGITWLTWSSDYTRFIRPGTSERKVFWSTSLGIFIPTVWLAFVGASVASVATDADPATLVTAAFGAASIPVLFLIMHGPVATNILNLFSASLAALSLDIKAKRWMVSVVVSIVGTVMLIVFIESDNFAADFDKWLASVVVWISAWGGVMLVDYFILRRGKIDVRALYTDPRGSIYGDVNWAAVTAVLAGLVAGWAREYGLVSFMQGPIAKATNNVDLSWLTGLLVAGVGYYLLRPFFVKHGEPQPVITT